MQIFAVIAIKGPKTIETALESVAPDDFYALKDDVWLVAFEGTTQQLAEKLGIRDGKNGTGLVAPIGNYSGRASTDLWEWLKVHWPSEGRRDDL